MKTPEGIREVGSRLIPRIVDYPDPNHFQPSEMDILTRIIEGDPDSFEQKVKDVKQRIEHKKALQKIKDEKAAKFTEEQRRQRNEPIPSLLRAVEARNREPELLKLWERKHAAHIGDIIPEFEELNRRRGIALTSTDIDFATNFLYSLAKHAEVEHARRGWRL